MRDIRRLLVFVKPYAAAAAGALLMLGTLVALDLAIPRLIQHIIDEGITKKRPLVVAHTALAMLGLSAVSTWIAVCNNVFSVRVGEGVGRDLRAAIFSHIQRYSFGNLDRQKTGALLIRLTSDVNAVKMLTQVSLRIGTRAPLLMLGSVVLMFTTDRQLALAILPFLLTACALIAFFITRMEPLFRRVQEKLDAVNTVLQENIAGAKLVKSLVRSDYEEQRFELANEEMTQRSVEVTLFTASMAPALTMCIQVGVVVAIWLGGLQAVHARLSLGQIVAFTNYLLTTLAPLSLMTLLSSTWAAGLASLRRIGETLDEVPDVRDAENAKALTDSRPDLALEDISFRYNAGSHPVLRDIQLVARAGQTTAILGATGAGKSTLVQLIPRFYDATAGRVCVGGRDVRELKHDSLISSVAVVPQESTLFSGTVRDNIRYGRPDASDDDVVAAAQAAQAHEFIMRLPQGYDSRIEQRGANLSGGQRQRVAIARALVVRPQILILDDSTSAVDVETETRIHRGIAETMKGRTTVLVAQRISTVLDADRIVVLDEGQIAAEGTHRELLVSSHVYREIYESQLGASSSAVDACPEGA